MADIGSSKETYGMTASEEVSVQEWPPQTGRQPTSDPRCGPALARGDQNKEFHHSIVDLATAALDDIHVAVASGFIDVDLSLTIAELGELAFGRCNAETIADGMRECRMRSASKELHASKHHPRHTEKFEDVCMPG